MTKATPLHPDIIPVFDSVALQIADSFREVLIRIIEAHPGRMSLPNDAFILLEMSLCNIMLQLQVEPGGEAKIMKVLTKNVVQDMARHRLRHAPAEGNA